MARPRLYMRDVVIPQAETPEDRRQRRRQQCEAEDRWSEDAAFWRWRGELPLCVRQARAQREAGAD